MASLDERFDILSVKNPQFATFFIVSSLLILKMAGLILLTIFYRQKNKIFSNEEDAKMHREGRVDTHPDIERVRRAVQNDLENIPAFIFMGFAYLFVGVPDWVVYFLFYLFLIVRTLHSIVYAVYVVPQPARGICFLIGFVIITYLSFHVLIYGFFVGYLGN